jgi:nucleoside phosphorylase
VTYRIELEWKVFSKSRPQGRDSVVHSDALFNVKGGKGFLRSLGGSIRSEYVPKTLEPTINFHHALKAVKAELDVTGKRFPIAIVLAGGVDAQVNITLRQYGSVVCASVRVAPFTTTIAAGLIELQDLKIHANLWRLICRVMAIAISDNGRATSVAEVPKIFPTMRVIAEAGDEENWESRSVAILTRHEAPNPKVVESVTGKNAPHQVDETSILIDRQGLFGYVPASCSAKQDQANAQRFNSAGGLLEFAYALRSDIRNGLRIDAATTATIQYPAKAIPDSTSSSRMWTLMVDEFSLQHELGKAVQQMTDTALDKILLTTVTDIETKKVLDAFARVTGQAARPMRIKGFVYQYLGRCAESDVYLTICEMGAGGIGGAQETIQRSIQALGASSVIMVGIAFGVDEDNQKIGQILVSKQLQLYDLQRVSKNDIVSIRGDKPSASGKLLNWVRNAKATWTGSHEIEVGLILTGQKLIDDRRFRDQLINQAPEAIGGEMEGAGLYVACQSAGVQWILIKAICDWADGEKSVNKKARQAKAAEASSNFVAHMLTSLGSIVPA